MADCSTPPSNIAATHGTSTGASLRPGVVQIATGAWFAPDTGTCQHGNPNVLTSDRGTSSLAQGPAANSCLVWVELAADQDQEPFELSLPRIERRAGKEGRTEC